MRDRNFKILGLIIFLVFFAATNNAFGEWSISTIDSSSTRCDYSSVVVDSNNKVHIAYLTNPYTPNAYDLKYITDESGSWVSSTIEVYANLGHPIIRLDSNNKVFISYPYNRIGMIPRSYFKYATNEFGPWSYYDILNYGVLYNSMAVDSNNKLHVSFGRSSYNAIRGTTTYSLIYGTNESGSWVFFDVDKSEIGYWDGISYNKISIAVDSNNKAHIGYYDKGNRDLKYATNISGSWVTETVDTNGMIGGIAVDSNNKAHISYYNLNNRDLKYATNESGSWVTVTAYESSGIVNSDSEIAIDSNNKVHISHLDQINGGNRYATNVSGSWVTVPIDSGGSGVSIAVDARGNAHISYVKSGSLKYAFINPKLPTITLTNPVNNSTDIPINTAITAIFSKSMDQSTINTATVTINNGVTGTVIYDPTTKTVTFTPSSNLAYATTYTATITTGVKDQIGNSMVSNYTWNFTTQPPPQYMLNIIKAGTGTGTITSADGLINCGSDCSESYNSGTVVTLIATPSTGSTFTGWSGDCSSTGQYVLTMTANKACTATFTLNQYVLTVNKSGAGSGSVTGAGTYNYGATATVTATATTGSTFTGWSGDCSGTVSSTTVYMNAAKTCTAAFASNTYTIKPAVSSGGTISPTSRTVNYGSTTTFTLNPTIGYTASISGNCGGSIIDNVYTTGVITSICTENITFVGNGTCGDANGQTFTTAPATNICCLGHASAVLGSGPWAWNCAGDNGGSTANCSANIQTYTVNFQSEGYGTLTGNTSQTVNYGANATTVTPNPATGYHFVNWTGTGGFVTTTDAALTVTNVTSIMTITAHFEADPANIGVLPASPVNFGSVSVGLSSSAQTFTISNTGNSNLVIGTVNSSANTEFVISNDNCSNQTIEVFGTCTVDVTFTPSTGGTRNSNLGIPSNDPDTAIFSIVLNGTGVYTITPIVVGNGTIWPDTKQTINHGSTMSFDLTAAPNHHIVDVTGTCGGTLVGTNYTTNAITADCSVVANFDYIITVIPGLNGTVTCIPNPVLPGNDSNCTIVPATGYHIMDVLIDDLSVGAVSSYPFINVTADHTISASFEQDPPGQVAQIIENVIISLPPLVFNNPNNVNALGNKIDSVIAMINDGQYQLAINKLTNDIIQKTDGCAATGQPDNNDWITDCQAQSQVYPIVVMLITQLQGM